MTIEEMQAEIERLKKELAQAKAEQRKAKRTKFMVPDEVSKKHKKLFSLQSCALRDERFFGNGVEDCTSIYLPQHLQYLSRFIRQVMCIHIVDFEMNKGSPTARIVRRAERYAKPFDEMTDEEYENYKNCLDEVLGVIEKYAK